MISYFFIDRPIFAAVLSIVITLAGSVALLALPVAQYPDITPPTVVVSASYPGANAETVRDTVAAPIEQQVSGVENMIYMASQCTNDGSYTLTVTFRLGTDPDMAQVLVQNRVSLAQPVIPDLVQRQGINVRKVSPSIMMIVNLVSAKDAQGKPVYNDLYLSNYATIQIKDELGRLEGVGNVAYLGERDYSMRAWLDPQKLATLNITAREVVNAISEQNLQVAAGQIGQQPVPNGQQFQLTINTLGRLVDAEQFGDIIVKVRTTNAQNQPLPSPSVVHLRDVARIELGSQQYDQTCTLDGQPSVALSIYQLPGSNALATAKGVYKKMEDLKKRFPPGLEYRIVYDTTPFIKESIVEVFKTLRDAIILVALVVLVFLQNWRAALIPLVAVPVAIVGTFAAMAAIGFSLNNLSLFGLVLAIGIVVDDAIVVVENVERWLALGKPAREAARKAMDEVTGPVVAVALVLCAVFVPCAFISGITGQFFRQFAITISVSTAISAFNSLTLSPALAALLLKPHSHEEKQEPLPRLGIAILFACLGAYLFHLYGQDLIQRALAASTHSPENKVSKEIPFDVIRFTVSGTMYATAALVAGVLGWLLAPFINSVLSSFFGAFNRVFNITTDGYTRIVGLLLRGSIVALMVYVGLLAMTGWAFDQAPTGFIPDQDKGYLLLNVQLPDSASVQRTQTVMKQVETIARKIPGVKSTVSISGQSLLLNANAPNLGWMYVILEEFDHRRAPSMSGPAIASEIRRKCSSEVRDGLVGVFGAPPIDGLGTAGGFKMIVEDRGNLGLAELQRVSDKIVDAGNDSKDVHGLFTSSRVDTPWIYLEIDRVKCMSLGVPVSEVFNTLQVQVGSYYVNNFNEFGRSWQVNVMADPKFRRTASDIKQLKVRNKQGQMVPLGTVIAVRDVTGPVLVMRYNMYASAAIYGNPRPGISSGESITVMDGIAEKHLPQAMAYDWTELTYMQLQAGNTAMYVFALAVVFVFLVLAAQYESWSLPLAVILVVPMCLLCAVTGVLIAQMDVNIFTQIGLVVLVGLASKNAILIVEFAKQQREEGQPTREATLEACRLRLRPIMMTSFAFILGVVPLVIAEGAGAEMRRALGTAVFSGMLGVTFFGIFLTPIFFFVIAWFGTRKAVAAVPAATPAKSAAKTMQIHPDGHSRETGIQERPDSL